MKRPVLVLLFLCAVTVRPAHAQFPFGFGFLVLDQANLAEATLIALRAQRHLNELRLQHATITRLARGLGWMDGYRIPGIGATRHDPARWTYGQPWIAGLVSGDPTGAAYRATTLPLEDPSAALAALSPDARRGVERQVATVEITDSVAMLGGHQVALARAYHGRLQEAIERLQADVLNGSRPYHQLTAILDKIAAGELVARRQDMATNQLLSHALEQLLARGKRQRDTEVATLNMQLTSWQRGHAAQDAFIAGASEALDRWRQP